MRRVNTGYGYVKQKNVTTEASKIDGTNKKYASYSSVYEMIQREVSGVRISGTDIIINESKDFFGNIPALLVVDGTYVTDFSNISPSSVESIEVLKGTAAAIYGSRGYGGAVVIKTKIKKLTRIKSLVSHCLPFIRKSLMFRNIEIKKSCEERI